MEDIGIERPGHDSAVVSHRHIALQGTLNFRDFGGYQTEDGSAVRWGQLYRSGSLSKLTQEDLNTLTQLNILSVCDFRHDDERAHEPTRWPGELDTRHVHLPLAEGDHAITLKELLNGPGPVTRDDVVKLMSAINREFVLSHTDVYAQVLQLALDTPGPLLIHCTAGKDRTGFGAAVILAALGVPQNTILQDYLLTGDYLVVNHEIDRLLERYRLSIPREVGIAVFGVQPEYLNAAFGAIHSEYGSLATYLRDGLNFNDAAQRELRARLLT